MALNFSGGSAFEKTSDIANILLRQFIARSDFLAPLGGIAETCWLIMLRLYATSYDETASRDKLGIVMNMPSERISRYLEALEDSSFIETANENGGGYRLADTTRTEIDEILRLMVQDIRSSFDR